MTEKDPTDVAGIEQAKQAQLEAQELAAERRAADLKQVLATDAGRRFVWGLLEEAGVFRISYTGEAMDTAFREGNRNVGLALLGRIMAAAPSRYTQMILEQQGSTNE